MKIARATEAIADLILKPLILLELLIVNRSVEHLEALKGSYLQSYPDLWTDDMRQGAKECANTQIESFGYVSKDVVRFS